MEKEFYVVLPSNTRSEAFPDNKISNFSVGLPSSLELGNYKWEVSLVSISYPHTWYNVEVSDAFIDIYMSNGHKSRRRFAPGYYNDGKEIIKKLNVILGEHELVTRFNYDIQSNAVSIDMYNGEHIKLSRGLAAMLGFHNRDLDYEDLGVSAVTVSNPENPYANPDDAPPIVARYRSADSIVDLSLRTHNLFIYTNIVKETLVGNTYMPLLRTVPTLDKNRGTYVSKNYTDPHYLPLSSNYIKHITIDIRDDQGQNIKFQSGKITVKLHFRMKGT